MNKTSNVRQSEWAFGEKTQLVERQDIIHIAILVTIAFVIGVYLIATTTLIAEDGVSYINYAKGLTTTPLKIIRDCSEYAPQSYTPGYPFLILMTHKLVDLLSDGSSVLSWIYSAQAAALFCRIFALISLYFVGKEFVGDKLSFWAILILTMLPYPARSGSDTLRDWPHLLFLVTGFLFLLRGAKNRKWLMFAVVGLVAGLGYMVRPECAQLVVYGILWLIFSMLRQKRKCNMSRAKLAGGLVLLIIGFAVVAAPYMKIRGEILPERLQEIIKSLSSNSKQNKLQQQKNFRTVNSKYMAGLLAEKGAVAKAFAMLIRRITEQLMYYFAPALVIGMYYYFRRKPENDSVFLITALLLLNIAVVVLRYCCSGPALSRRYILPFIAFTIFFVPIGLQIVGRWLGRKLYRGTSQNEVSQKESQRWFFVLLIIGLVICVPKLLRPIRIEKKGYRLAAEWLKTNTPVDSVIAVPDSRISFYAGRNMILSRNRAITQKANFNVKLYKNNIKPLYSDGAFNFNGTSDQIDLGPDAIALAADFTISAWIYCQGNLDGDTDEYATAFGAAKWSGVAIEGIVVRISPDGFLRLSFGDGSRHNHIGAIKNITTTNKNKWYHITVVHKSSELMVYINGKFLESATFESTNQSQNNFQIGHAQLNPTQSYWYGSVKNLRLFTKGLSTTEVFNLYSAASNSPDPVCPVKYTLDIKNKKENSRLIIYQVPLFSLKQALGDI